MIEIKLKDIADRLGKNIMDIARETGLNRNTVTDLYHNKVDGIKFSTIDVLCDTYGITLPDLVARKEFRIGGAPASRIVRDIRSATPFFSWLMLNALHKPSPEFFDGGVGNIYAYFVRGGAEFYFDRKEACRCAHLIYERYGRDGLEEIYTTFIRSRDQVLTNVDGLALQPLKQYTSAYLLKAFRRLSDLYADMLAVSAWIDAFDFGVQDEMVAQVQKAHNFTSAELSLLLASGERTASVIRRLALLELAEISGDAREKESQRFLQDYPFVTANALAESIQTYTSHPKLLKEEKNVLSQLPRRHTDAVKAVLRAHNMRVNPLAFFATLQAWRDERDETDLRVRFQMERILNVAAERFHVSPAFAPYLMPQELEHAQSGLVTDHTLQYRYEQGLLVALEHGEFQVSEGDRAISIQDDLASRYVSQLSYENVS